MVQNDALNDSPRKQTLFSKWQIPQEEKIQNRWLPSKGPLWPVDPNLAPGCFPYKAPWTLSEASKESWAPGSCSHCQAHNLLPGGWCVQTLVEQWGSTHKRQHRFLAKFLPEAGSCPFNHLCGSQAQVAGSIWGWRWDTSWVSPVPPEPCSPARVSVLSPLWKWSPSSISIVSLLPLS